jgi:hypothetical protein
MDFTRPKRCRRQRTGREDRRSNFYEISDNLDRGGGSDIGHFVAPQTGGAPADQVQAVVVQM